MRILIACEFSGIVRDAFRKRGHDAWSCDLLPTEADPQWHIQEEVEMVWDEGWDMMIAFPPCTYLCSSGLHWNKRRPGREEKTHEAMLFVFSLVDRPIARIALENPVGCISTNYRKPDQKIHPWQFGHPESKTTCLWLKNLPPLIPTKVLPLPESGRWANQTPSGQNKLGPSEKRAMERSRTYPGIAEAMADQWGTQP